MEQSSPLCCFMSASGTAPYKSDAQRKQTIGKGIESNLQFTYVLHELDEATEKVEDKRIDKADGEL